MISLNHSYFYKYSAIDDQVSVSSSSISLIKSKRETQKLRKIMSMIHAVFMEHELYKLEKVFHTLLDLYLFQ